MKAESVRRNGRPREERLRQELRVIAWGDGLDMAIARAGGVRGLAELVGVRYQAVQQWRQSGRVPAGRAIQVALLCGWEPTPHQLRPDLYPHPDDGLPELLVPLIKRANELMEMARGLFLQRH